MLASSSDCAAPRSNNNDCRFSLLRLTSSDGKPVICIAVIKAERLAHEEIQGMGINVPFFESDSKIQEIEMSAGKGNGILEDLSITFVINACLAWQCAP